MPDSPRADQTLHCSSFFRRHLGPNHAAVEEHVSISQPSARNDRGRQVTLRHARRLPAHQGRAPWNAILGPQPAANELEGLQTADVVVIGAGFAGLSAARRLLQIDPDLKISILEAGRVAEGSAGRNSGFMIDLPHELASDDYAGAGDDGALTARNRIAIEFAAQAVSEYQINPTFFDRAGKINAAVSDVALSHNQSYAAHLHSLGEPHDLLDSQAMRDVTGSAHYNGGLYTPGTVLLQPAGYIRGLADGLSRKVKIFERSPVWTMSRQDRDWLLVTPKGRLTTPRVIMATNGHLESFGYERGRLMQLFLYGVMSPELDASTLTGSPRWGITPSDPMGTSVRRIETGHGRFRLLVRSCATLLPGMMPSAAHLRRAARVMQRKFDQRFPGLAGLQMEHAWSGHLCLSLNSVAVCREIETGLFAACVQNGLGTTRGTLTGMAAAELALGQSSELTRHFTSEARPRMLPPRPIRELGANVLLRFREWRARAE